MLELYIQGPLLDEVARYLPYQVTNATYMITVADSTPPSTIAAQIGSRLLPEHVNEPPQVR